MFNSFLRLEFFDDAVPSINSRRIRLVEFFKITKPMSIITFNQEVVPVLVSQAGVGIGTYVEFEQLLAIGIPALWDKTIICTGITGKTLCYVVPRPGRSVGIGHEARDIPENSLVFITVA